MKIHFLYLAILFASSAVHASDVIELPEDELAREIVLPKFSNKDTVLNRNLVTEGRIEAGLNYGWIFTEPIHQQSHFNLLIGYHFSETSAFQLLYSKWGTGLNKTYTDPLAAGNKQLDFSRSPAPKQSIYALYEWKSYYGKLSLTKQSISNFLLFPFFGIGMDQYSHKSFYGVLAGLGWKFFMTDNIGLRTSLRMSYSEAPSPFLGGGKLNATNTNLPSPDEFGSKWGFNTVLDFGLTVLF